MAVELLRRGAGPATRLSGILTVAAHRAPALAAHQFVGPALRAKSSGAASHVGLIVTTASGATKLGPEVDLAEAALYKMVGVARHGTRLARIEKGDVVAPIGRGLIGQMSAETGLGSFDPRPVRCRSWLQPRRAQQQHPLRVQLTLLACDLLLVTCGELPARGRIRAAAPGDEHQAEPECGPVDQADAADGRSRPLGEVPVSGRVD
jgi:hypothetical protein